MYNGTLVTGLFVDPLDAHRCVNAMIDSGFNRDDISIIASGGRGNAEFAIERRSRVGDGAAIGAGLGGASQPPARCTNVSMPAASPPRP
jgi:hypothetical protein